MHFQRQNRNKYQTFTDYSRSNQTQYPRTNQNSRQANYRNQKYNQKNIMPSPYELNSEKQLEMSNDETNPQNIYKSNNNIHSIRNNIIEKYTPSQLIGDQPLSSQLHNFTNRFGEERDPSPKTINVGDTKESIEYKFIFSYTKQ